MYKSPAAVPLAQAKFGHEPTQGSMPWPKGSAEAVGRNESITVARL